MLLYAQNQTKKETESPQINFQRFLLQQQHCSPASVFLYSLVKDLRQIYIRQYNYKEKTISNYVINAHQFSTFIQGHGILHNNCLGLKRHESTINKVKILFFRCFQSDYTKLIARTVNGNSQLMQRALLLVEKLLRQAGSWRKEPFHFSTIEEASFQHNQYKITIVNTHATANSSLLLQEYTYIYLHEHQ